MRYVRILLLHLSDVFQNRGKAFIWFLVSFINPLLLIIFWQGTIKQNGEIYGEWTRAYLNTSILRMQGISRYARNDSIEMTSSNSITIYYLLVVIISGFLVVHIEEDVAFRDIPLSLVFVTID